MHLYDNGSPVSRLEISRGSNPRRCTISSFSSIAEHAVDNRATVGQYHDGRPNNLKKNVSMKYTSKYSTTVDDTESVRFPGPRLVTRIIKKFVVWHGMVWSHPINTGVRNQLYSELAW